jgi:uncharacterized damage-inducible protein DinB
MVRLAAVLDSWKSIRQDTIQAWLDMPAADAGFRPTPDLMPYRDLAEHILRSSHAMVAMLLAGETDFSAPGFRDRMKTHWIDASALDAAGLAARLESTLAEDSGRLGAATPEFYAQTMTRFDGTAVTRLEMVQYAKEHELTHRSQMFMYLRLKGMVPPTTKRRMAAK